MGNNQSKSPPPSPKVHFLRMEQGYPPQQQTPPYPGPPMNYGGAMPQPGQHAQPGYYPAAPPPMHQG
ncbi:hypothetical protein KUCAC02_007944, partial [Chaenocephalus aceratus]